MLRWTWGCLGRRGSTRNGGTRKTCLRTGKDFLGVLWKTHLASIWLWVHISKSVRIRKDAFYFILSYLNHGGLHSRAPEGEDFIPGYKQSRFISAGVKWKEDHRPTFRVQSGACWGQPHRASSRSQMTYMPWATVSHPFALGCLEWSPSLNWQRFLTHNSVCYK